MNRTRSRMLNLVKTALRISASGAISLSLGAAPALAMGAPIHITSTVNVRPGPSTASGNPLGAIPTGASPDFQCWTQGQNVNGVDVWFNVIYNGLQGYYASYWDDSHYSTDAQITPKYGIPQCGTSGPSPAPPPSPPSSPPSSPSAGTSGVESAAVNWARPLADQHSRRYNELCLTFVFRAYAAAGINLRPWVNVPIGYNTYPQDIWGHFTHGQTGGGTPPAGALVFFKPTNNDRRNSHVVLSAGGGTLISTSDRVAGYTHYETLAQHRYAIYLGWWLPDR